ncbi:MAG: septum formation initiator family protein [bacterium]|nr:septum formation initiator family protein [bacterium]MDZ4299621.1 septum formation initiator family protein [Candidatus Sungbacteria bacterium]
MKYLIRRLMRPLPLFLAVIVLIVGYGAAGMVRSAMVLRAETRVAEEKIRALTQRKTELEAAIYELQTPQAAEREAKERFNLKKTGERVVVVVPPEEKKSAAPVVPASVWDRVKAIFH